MQRECRDLFRLADPAYGLARNEGGAGAFIIAPGAQALLKRGGIDSARAYGVATDTFADIVGGNRFGQADYGRLGDCLLYTSPSPRD